MRIEHGTDGKAGARLKEGKAMGRYCNICGRIRPNENFGGKGRRRYVCRDCRRRPKAEVEQIEREDEIQGFLEQSNISAKNIQRLETLTHSELPGIADLASLVLAVARVKPHKRRRFKFLASRHRDLLNKLIQGGLFYGYVDEAIALMDDDEAEAFFHLGFDCGEPAAEDGMD
jgi:hypothetical protein